MQQIAAIAVPPKSATPLRVVRQWMPAGCLDCAVRPLGICGALAEKDLGRLAAARTPTVLEPGRVLIDEGNPATHFFIITSGTARLFKLLPDGRFQVTGFAGPGYILGLANGSTYSFSADAVEPLRACRFRRADMLGLLAEFRPMERWLLEHAAHELVASQEQMLLLGRKTARERVASFLLARAALKGGVKLVLPMSRSDIAGYLGLTVETVSRTLTWFRTTRLIALPSPSVVLILQFTALEELAAGRTGSGVLDRMAGQQ